MKKLLYCAAALATLLFAASCQQEKLEPVGGPVTFTVTAPGGLDTRAYADGENVNEVHWAVYRTTKDYVIDETDEIDGALAQGVVPMSNKTATVELDLLQDQYYTILFWAQVKDAGHYELGDLREVKIKYNPLYGNDESRAAFFQRHDFSTFSQQNYDVTLYRPFAQINLGTTAESLTPSQDGQTQGYTIDVRESKMTVKGLATSFDLLKGEGKDEAVEFTFNSTPTPAKNGQTLTVNDTDYHYIAMNYLIVPILDKTVEVSYEITTDKGVVTNTIGSVPVKENFRTNIIGNLLTSKTEFDIIVDKEFNKPDLGPDYIWGGEVQAVTPVNDVYSISTAAELAWVAQQVNSGENTFEGKTVQLVADIDLNNQPWTPIGLNADDAKKFKGTFEGVALTKADTYPVIRNLYVETSPGYTAAGFFGALNGTAKNFGIENATIKHISTGDPTDNGIAVVAGSIYNKGTIEGVTVKNATVEGNRYVGGIAGYTYGNVKNCSVENLTLKATPNQLSDGSYDNGDKVGGIVAAFWWENTYNVSGNTAKNVSIYAYRDAGIIAGFATGAGVKNNTVEGKNNITIDQETYFYKDKPANAGEIVGYLSGTLADGNTVTGEVSYTTLINVDDAESFAGVLAAAKDGDIISVPAGEFALPSTMFDDEDNGTITLVGNGIESTQLNGAKNPYNNANNPGNYANGKDLVFKNMTFVTVNNGYQGGFGHAKSVTFINCKIIGQFYCHSEAPHYFYDCTIDPLTGYLYTYASDCVFEGCTFEASEGKALQVYEDSSNGENTVTIKDCDFIAAKQATTWDGKPVTGIDINSNGAIFNVTIDNCKTTGFPTGFNSGSDLYNIKGGADKVNLIIDGVYVNRAGYTQLASYPNIYVKDNNYYVFDKAGLADLNKYFADNWCGNDTWNHEYHIGSDIDATGFTWNSVWVNVGNNGNNGLVLNGNNHTISNMAINGSLFTGTPNGGDAGTTPGYVKNIVIDNATVKGDHFTAVFWGNSYGELVYENVTVKNTEVTGACNVAVFLGATVIDYPSTAVDQVLFKNCSVENCTLLATGKDGQDPNGAAVYCSRAYGKTTLKFEGTNSIDEATTLTNENGLVGGKVYGYTLLHNGEWVGTGACDEFENWYGLEPGVANVKDLAGIQAALADDEVEAVKIVSAIEIEDEEVTLDLNNKPITAVASDAFVANAGAKLTLKNGNVSSHEAAVRAIGGEVVIESGKYVQTGTAVGSTPATYRYCLDAREGGKITVNGGEFESKNGIINVNSGCELVINGGKFTSTIEKSMTRHFAYVGGKLTIKDGEFFGKANAGAGGCFLCGAASGAEILIEGGKFTSLLSTGKVNKIFEVYYGGTITVTGGLFNTNGGITSFVTENTDEATKAAYPYVAK